MLLNKKTKRSLDDNYNDNDIENDENINININTSVLFTECQTNNKNNNNSIEIKDKYFPTQPHQDDLSHVKLKQKYLTLHIFSYLTLKEIELLFTSLPNSYFNTLISKLLFKVNISLYKEHRFTLGKHKINFFNFTENNYSTYFRYYYKKISHKIPQKVNYSLYNPINKEIYGINNNSLYIGTNESELLNKDIIDKIKPLSHFHFINNNTEIALFGFQSTIFISLHNEQHAQYDYVPLSASYVIENTKGDKFMFADINGTFHIYSGDKDNIQHCQVFNYSISSVNINDKLLALYSSHDNDCNDIIIYNVEIKEIECTIIPCQKIKKLFYHNEYLIGISSECIFYWKKNNNENEYKVNYVFNYKKIINDKIYFITYAEYFLSYAFVVIIEENNTLVSKLLLLNTITKKYNMHTLGTLNYQLPTLYTSDSFFYCVTTTSKSNPNKRKLYIYATDCELTKANSLCLQIFTITYQN